ncbi:MAG TPA: hypothetical protein VJA65_09130, partial [bacterium]|nr:hypothetical protein [bacterium]
WVLAGMIAGAYLLVALLPAWGFPQTVWLGLAGLVPGAAATWIARETPEVTRRLIHAQVAVLSSFVLMAAGSGVGLLL